MQMIFNIFSIFCCLQLASAAFQGLCGRGSRAGREECFEGQRCPEGHSLVGRQYTLCYDSLRKVSGVCCARITTRLSLDSSCGVVKAVTGRIGFGEDAPRCSAPWQVSFRSRDNKNVPVSVDNSIHWCGGTLISSQHVLTTPLCLFSAGAARPGDSIKDDVVVVAGDWDHRVRDYYGGQLSEQYFRVASWAVHPDYPAVNSLHDINNLFLNRGEPGFHANGFVVVKLDRPIAFTDCVRPACLTNHVNDFARSPCGLSECKMSGWGNSETGDLKDHLQQATLEMPNFETCEAIEYYGGNYTSLPAKTTCAISLARPPAFHCVGDQGGPVVCRGSDGRWTLRGAMLARLLCDSRKPVPVADVTRVFDWVLSTLQNL